MDILKGIGRPKTTTKIILVGAFFNLITNFYFIPRYGMLGAGVTSSLSYFLILVLSLFYLNRNIKLKIPWMIWTKIFSSGIIFVFLIYLLKGLLDLNLYLEFFICTFVSGSIYIMLMFIFKVVNLKELNELFLNKLKI